MKTIDSTRRFVHAWCQDRGIDIVEDDKVRVPCAARGSGGSPPRIYLPRLSSVNYEEWERMTYHESGHLDPENQWHYDALDIIRERDGQNSLPFMVCNMLVDNLSERTKYSEYRGRAKVLASSRMKLVADNFDSFGVAHEGYPDDLELLTALARLDMANREKWMLNMVSPIKPIPGSTYDEKLKTIPFDEMLDRIGNSKDPFDLVQMADAIAALAPPSEKGDGEGEGEGESEGEGGEGKGDGKDKGKGSSSKPNGGEDEKGGGESEGGDEEGGPGKSEKEEAAGGGTAEEKGEEAFKAKKAVIYSEGSGKDAYTNNALAPPNIADNIQDIQLEYHRSNLEFYIPHPKITFNDVRESRLHTREDQDRYHSIKELVDKCTLGRQMRKYLQLKSQGRVVHGKERGRVSGKSLHRLFLPTESSMPRIFKEEEHGKVKLDTAVGVLVDLSGSMGGGRTVGSSLALASASAVALSSVLSGLHVRHEILGFTEGVGVTMMYCFKSFSSPMVSKENLIKRFANGSIARDSNADGESLQFAAERLHKQTNPNKILIVLSDGRPAGHYKGDGAWYLKQVVKDIVNNSTIKLIGIGIASTSVRDFYPNYEVVNHIEELPEAVLKTLKSCLL